MYQVVKRIIDTIIACVMLIIISPILLIVAIAVKLDSKGPAIFKQDRIGKDFKPFKMYKFRSMVVNAQNMGTGVYAFAGDPRITKVGRIIRKTSLDELPQLWNIMKGDMAFVGPRAPVVGHFPAWKELNEAYRRRFTILPGITGLAQVTGRNELPWDEKVYYDNVYIDKIKKYGILYDAKMWFMTFIRVLSMKDVEESQKNMEKNKQGTIGDNK